MRLIGEAEIAARLDYRRLIPAMERALADYSAGKVVQPVRTVLTVEPGQRFFGAMPVASASGVGAKLVCFYPANAGGPVPTHTALIALFDRATGEPKAVLDGRLITEMRTAAVSAAVTRYLARPGARTLALLGAGVQAEAHLEALAEVMELAEVRVWSRTPANAQAFATRHGAVAMAAEEAVRGADVVVVATSSPTPVLAGASLAKGAHVNAVGANRHDWRELDDAVMAHGVVVDSRAGAMAESGDVILSGATILAEAGEIFAGGVTVDRERTTVFKSLGMAVEDLVTAELVLELLEAG